MSASILSRLTAAATGAGLLAVVLLATFSGPSDALAVEPGVNCSFYSGPGGGCVVEVGDIWFCDISFQEGVCPTSIVAGDTVRWQYPADKILLHTTTACGADCDNPTSNPRWDSGILEPGDSFEYTFTTPGEYLYYCTLHPATHRGIIRVLDGSVPDGVGDVDCSGGVSAIDAALVLQLTAGLLAALPCPENADTNEDGATNAIDATLILQLSAGLLSTLPP